MCSLVAVLSSCAAFAARAPLPPGTSQPSRDFERMEYDNPGATSYLGVGLWAWPMAFDYDGDGDLDLVVSCPDVPYNGTYFFEKVEKL